MLRQVVHIVTIVLKIRLRYRYMTTVVTKKKEDLNL